MSNKYVWRVVVTEAGDKPRPVVPPQLVTEPETGAVVEAIFWPPEDGATRHYLSRSAAFHRHDWWLMNGVKSEVTRSLPISWPELPTHTHDGIKRDKAIRPRSGT